MKSYQSDARIVCFHFALFLLEAEFVWSWIWQRSTLVPSQAAKGYRPLFVQTSPIFISPILIFFPTETKKASSQTTQTHSFVLTMAQYRFSVVLLRHKSFGTTGS